MLLLQIQNLAVHYGAVHAIKDVSFSVEQGSIVALIGANGAGKTTILKTISGLVKPSGGDILFAGQSLKNIKPEKIVGLGVVHAPEGRGIFSNLTVEENLKLGCYLKKSAESFQQQSQKVLELFPRLKERLWQNAGTLSGGEQQMLAIARALLMKPKILLLDEPSLGLAPQMTQKIFETIVTINRAGTTLLLVEQNAQMALEIAHQAIVLETGKVAVTGTGRELLNSPEIKKAYLGG